MDTDVIYTFLAVAKAKSISKAATEINISQSAISKQIMSLESTFQAKLFVRDYTGVELTDEGHIFLRYSKELLEKYEKLKRTIKNKQYESILTIGTVPSIAIRLLKIKQFQFQRNNIYISDNIPELIHKYNKHSINTIILERKFKENLNDYIEYPLFEEHIYIALPNSINYKKTLPIQIDKLKELSCIFYKDNNIIYKKTEEIFMNNNLHSLVCYEAPFLQLLLAIISKGNYYTLVSQSSIDLINTPDIFIAKLDIPTSKSISIFVKNKMLYKKHIDTFIKNDLKIGTI